MNIRTRLAKLEAANPGLIPDGSARERILARLAAMHERHIADDVMMPQISFDEARAMMAGIMSRHRTR